MFIYIVRHFNLLVLTLFVLSLFSFWLAFLFPGDPLINLAGVKGASEQEYAQLVAKYHFEQNLLQQYWRYIMLLFEGDWGVSFSSGNPLWDEITQSLPASLELSAYALTLSLVIGAPLGFVAGLKHNKPADYGLLAASVVGYSIPVFWLALILMLVFSIQLGWFPLSGRINLLFDVPHNSGFILIDIWLSDMPNKQAVFINALQHLVMPVLSITIVTTAIILRMIRRSIIEVMPQEYIQAAYTRGLSDYQVIMRHGVRNALLPIIPLLAMQTTTLLTNAMIVEVIFSWPGIGNWLIQAIYQRDFPAIRAGMLAVSSVVIVFTVSIDLMAKLINPTKDKGARVSH